MSVHESTVLVMLCLMIYHLIFALVFAALAVLFNDRKFVASSHHEFNAVGGCVAGMVLYAIYLWVTG